MGENTAPSTEFPRIFCAGIGPLQLGVVLLSIFIKITRHTTTIEGGIIMTTPLVIYVLKYWRKVRPSGFQCAQIRFN